VPLAGPSNPWHVHGGGNTLEQNVVFICEFGNASPLMDETGWQHGPAVCE